MSRAKGKGLTVLLIVAAALVTLVFSLRPMLATSMPTPAIPVCDETLPEGVPDFSGMWNLSGSENAPAFMVEAMGRRPLGSKLAPLLLRLTHMQRIEQCGIDFAITANRGRDWIVHEFRADGTREGGADDHTLDGTPVRAIAELEDGVLLLHGERVEGDFLVHRQLVGQGLVMTVFSVDTDAAPMRLYFSR